MIYSISPYLRIIYLQYLSSGISGTQTSDNAHTVRHGAQAGPPPRDGERDGGEGESGERQRAESHDKSGEWEEATS